MSLLLPLHSDPADRLPPDGYAWETTAALAALVAMWATAWWVFV